MKISAIHSEELIALTGGSWISFQQPFIIDKLYTDSRNVETAEKSMFVAITGQNHNGHDFIGALYLSGIKNFMVSDPRIDYSQYKGCNFLLVDDALAGLQRWAAAHRKKFNIPVIGITGSNGKTTVKEWLYQLMKDEFHIVRSPKSFNSQLGVPLSVLQMNEEHTLAIFEAGISQPGEMHNLKTIIEPTIGIFTNLGTAHAVNFRNTDEHAEEKLKLFGAVKVLITSSKHSYILNKCAEKNIPLYTWGTNENDQLKIESSTSGNFLQLTSGGETLELPFTDQGSAENLQHCIATLKKFEYSIPDIFAKAKNIQPIEMRLEVLPGMNGCYIINDTYSFDISSLKIALDFLHNQKRNLPHAVILSDISEVKGDKEKLYQEIADLINLYQIKKCIGIGHDIISIKNKIKCETYFYKDIIEFTRKLSDKILQNEFVLIKGNRKSGFHGLVKILEQKTHETVLKVDLNALTHNLNYYRSLLKPETLVMVMVKAFAYGGGSDDIASLLEFNRVNYLAVAYADEGVALREAGITLPVMVMNPEKNSFAIMHAYKLEPEIYSLRILNELINYYQSHSNTSEIKIHLKFDTGMHRLGFEEKDADALIDTLKENPFLHVASIFSHLASADMESCDTHTQQQIDIFNKVYDKLSAALKYAPLKHLLNSPGIERWPQAQFDMVRLGIGLYGIAAAKNIQPKLLPVHSLETTITQIRKVKKGDAVGYSRKGLLARDSDIAVIPLGYADGYSRHFSNGKGKVWVNGNLSPVVGNVCMDMTMIDVTGLNVKEGDRVVIFGKELDVAEVSGWMGTIPYELLTSVSGRVKRIYIREV